MKRPVFDSAWSEEMRRLWEHDVSEIWDPARAPHVWIQYHNQLRLYQSLLPESQKLRIADVGCAQATLALLLAETGHEVTAVDLRQHFLDYAASRHESGEIRYVCGNVLEMAVHGPFDVVFCNQLVEHVVYPERLMTRLAEWLRPGGLLVVTTPNGRYVRNSLPPFSALGDRARHEHRQFTADGDGHFFAYLPRELKALFPEEVFSSIEVSVFETPWVSGHMKVRFVQPLIGERTCSVLDKAVLAIPGIRTLLAHQLLGLGRKR